jgi:hypothetical protein
VPADPSRTAIMITAWRRPYYLEPSLLSWAKASGIADISRVVVALGPTDKYTQQVALIERLRPRFACPVEIVMQSPEAVKSNGPHRAIAEAITGIFAKGGEGFVIASEEDVVVSSDALAYMAWARDKFAGDEKVLLVNAHNEGGQGWNLPVAREDGDADQHAVRLKPYYSGWAWGTWQDRWEKALEPQWDYECDSGDAMTSGYDWNIQLRTIPAGNYSCVTPDAARSQNTGRAGGWSTPPNWDMIESKSFRREREPGGYELVQ